MLSVLHLFPEALQFGDFKDLIVLESVVFPLILNESQETLISEINHKKKDFFGPLEHWRLSHFETS